MENLSTLEVPGGREQSSDSSTSRTELLMVIPPWWADSTSRQEGKTGTEVSSTNSSSSMTVPVCCVLEHACFLTGAAASLLHPEEATVGILPTEVNLGGRGLPVGSPMMPSARSVATILMLRTSTVTYCLKLVAQLFNSSTKTNAFV